MGVGNERVIIFDKDGIVQLKKGVIVCIKGDKFEIHSSDRKEVTYFDNEGRFVDKHPTIAESHGYTDLGCLKYFFKMGKKERKVVKGWIKKQKPKNVEEEIFFEIVRNIVDKLHYGYYIATIEASFDERGLYYSDVDKACTFLSDEEWAIKAKEFAPEYKSDLASMYELYYWLAYKMAKGEMTLKNFNQISLNRIVLRGL